MEKNYKKVFNARSKENGVIFYSNKTPWLCYEAIIDDCGEIHASPISTVVSELFDFCGVLISRKGKGDKWRLILKTIFMVLVIVCVIMKETSIAVALAYFSLTGVNRLVDFSMEVYEIKFGDSKSLGRFHSAEHMTTIAYEKHQRIPTMEEIKKESRFEKYCGSRMIIDKLVFKIFLTLIIASSSFVSVETYIFLVILDIVGFILEKKINFLRFFQILLTNKPTDIELKVALEAIKLFDTSESNIESNDMMCEVSFFKGILF